MKWFLKKSSDSNPCKVLNEKDIQEKLYGEYREPDISEFENPPVSGSENSLISEIGTQTKTAPHDFQPLTAEQGRQPAELFFDSKKDPVLSDVIRIPGGSGKRYRFLISFLTARARILKQGGIILAVFVSLFVIGKTFIHPSRELKQTAGTFRQSKENMVKPKVKYAPPVSSKLKVVSESSQAQESSGESTGTDDLDQAGKPVGSEILASNDTGRTGNELPLGPSYSVQVCIYYRESDAKRLVRKLAAFNLNPYYESAPRRSGEGKLYKVLIGKDDTWTDAEVRMSQFKKLPVSEDFSDAYIRRVT